MREEKQLKVARGLVEIVPMILKSVGPDLREIDPNLSPAHLRVMRYLAHQSCNLGELARSQEVTLATMSNSIAFLADRGWVTRIPAADDRRKIIIEITPQGKEFFSRIHSQLREQVFFRLSNLSDDDLATLEQSIDVLAKLFDLDRQKKECDPSFLK